MNTHHHYKIIIDNHHNKTGIQHMVQTQECDSLHINKGMQLKISKIEAIEIFMTDLELL